MTVQNADKFSEERQNGHLVHLFMIFCDFTADLDVALKYEVPNTSTGKVSSVFVFEDHYSLQHMR